MTTEILIETLAAIKKVNISEIKNIDTCFETFELGKSRYSYELTPSGKYVKNGSVKYLSTISDYANCSI
jgi:hypothetical protein